MTPIAENNKSSSDREAATAEALRMCDKYYHQMLARTSFRGHLTSLPKNIQLPADSKNVEISTKVLERLLLRHAILQKMEGLEERYEASRNYIPDSLYPSSISDDEKPISNASICGIIKKSPSPKLHDSAKLDSARSLRACRIATTDLFVEKAIAYLEDDYDHYLQSGKRFFYLGLAPICLGTLASFAATFPKLTQNILSIVGIPIPDRMPVETWQQFAVTFITSFTFYGFLVILLVYCLRIGRAMIGQAERLRERRHSLRQGRLFIHLRNGEVTAEELVSAFDWNVTKGNAFENIPTEASAPWGAVIKEAIKAIPDAISKIGSSAK